MSLIFYQWNNMWIVLAKDAKDAIEQVYQEYVVPMNEDCRRENKEPRIHRLGERGLCLCLYLDI